MKRLLASALVVLAACHSNPPATPAQSAAAAQKPKPAVYDESADGAKQIAGALAKAKRDHKRVLVQWGANWCGWCIKLHELYRSDKDIAHELLYEYETVFVDAGKFDKHLELAGKYSADFKAHGLPYLTVLDEDGKLVVNQDSGELEVPKSDHHDPSKVLGFLKTNQATPLKADELLAAALARAKSEHKRLYTHFGAPW
jgi:thiol-disulfide isomerase/thioredoxin